MIDPDNKKNLEQRTACFGVCCPIHAHCQRYHQVDRANAATRFIATCNTFDRSMYIAIVHKQGRSPA